VVHTIGVDVDDLGLRPREALRRAAELSFTAVEIGGSSGDVSPAALTTSGRRHLAKYVDGLGLSLAALSAELPGLRLTDARTVDERVTRTCEVLQLAADLRVATVTASVGALTHPADGEPSSLALEALRWIGEFADSRGVTYALRTSQERAENTARVLEALRCPALCIGLDPAMLVMTGVNPVSLVQRLGPEIALVHARDGTVGSTERSGRETRLGDGEVDFVGLLAALHDTDYSGPFVLRRTDSTQPEKDLAEARETLRRWL
jgi:sugar phosphate isomerase/epimerase